MPWVQGSSQMSGFLSAWTCTKCAGSLKLLAPTRRYQQRTASLLCCHMHKQHRKVPAAMRTSSSTAIGIMWGMAAWHKWPSLKFKHSTHTFWFTSFFTTMQQHPTPCLWVQILQICSVCYKQSCKTHTLRTSLTIWLHHAQVSLSRPGLENRFDRQVYAEWSYSEMLSSLIAMLKVQVERCLKKCWISCFKYRQEIYMQNMSTDLQENTYANVNLWWIPTWNLYKHDDIWLWYCILKQFTKKTRYVTHTAPAHD